MDEELAEGDPVSMETLERTAAWVKEVATMKAEIMVRLLCTCLFLDVTHFPLISIKGVYVLIR